MPFNAVIAAIDVGSNATRLRIFRLDESGALAEISRHRFGVQLGAGAFQAGALAASQMEAAAAALVQAADLARAARATATLAVATSAVREAANGEEFIARVQREAGLTLRIIDGNEEAQLAALGAVAFEDRTREIGSAGAYVIDIGGGSTELARANCAGELRWHASLPLGAVRYADEWGRGPMHEERLRKHRKNIQRAVDSGASAVPGAIEQISRDSVRRTAGDAADKANPLVAYALGGTPSALADMRKAMAANRPREGALHPTGTTQPGEEEIGRAEVERLIEVISRSKLEELCNVYGVREARAGLLLPGAIILAAVMQSLKVEAILPTDRGVCEGLAVRWSRE